MRKLFAPQQAPAPVLIQSIVWHVQTHVAEYGRIRATFPGPCVRAAIITLSGTPPQSPEGVPEIVEAESSHIALLRELALGLDPSLSLAGLHQNF